MKMVYALIALTNIGIHAADWVKEVPADDTEKKLIHSILAQYKSQHDHATCTCKKVRDSWDEELLHIGGCEGGYQQDTENGKKYVSRTVVNYYKDDTGKIHTRSVTLHYTDHQDGTSAQTKISSTTSWYVDGRETGAIEGRFPLAAAQMPESFKKRRAVKAAHWRRVFADERHGNA
jgi:hypothetical protein